MKRTTKMALFCSLLIILAAQFSVNVFFADFEISIAVVLLPVFLSVSDRFPPAADSFSVCRRCFFDAAFPVLAAGRQS